MMQAITHSSEAKNKQNQCHTSCFYITRLSAMLVDSICLEFSFCYSDLYTRIFVGKKVGTSCEVTHSKPNWAATSAFLQKSKFLMKMFLRLLVRCKYSFAQMVPVPETISQDALFHFKLESHSLLLTKCSSSIFGKSFCVQLNSIIFVPNMMLNWNVQIEVYQNYLLSTKKTFPDFKPPCRWMEDLAKHRARNNQWISQNGISYHDIYDDA